MQPAPLPRNESARLQALEDCRILDTEPEATYDGLAQLAARVCRTPISLVSLVDAKRQWFKARVGLEARETPREFAFCAHAILEPTRLFVVEDARADPRFFDNPLVTEAPGLRFYAGMPLCLPSGECLGTLCVIDRDARVLEASILELLRLLGLQAAANLHASRELARLEMLACAPRVRPEAHEQLVHRLDRGLRTSLHTLVGAQELLQRTRLDAEQSEFLAMAMQSCHDLQSLLTNLRQD